MKVRDADPEEVIDLRARILRPGRPRQSAIFLGDDNPLSCHVVALVQDKIVGVGSAIPEPVDATPGMRIRGMAVEESHRHQGVGGAILDRLLERTNERVIWCNARPGAIELYLSRGFFVDGPEFLEPGLGPHQRMILLRDPF